MTEGREELPQGSAGPQTQLLASLAARTQEILEAPRPAPDPQQREREKQVVAECRYLMRLLSTRRRSEGEMRQRLEEREVPADQIHEVMARIARAGLIDDAAFARDWIDQRRLRKGLSDRALREELRQRGVAERDIAAAFSDLAPGDGPLDQDPALAEEERCRTLVKDRLRRESRAHLSDPRTRGRISRRLDGYLRRRGYEGSLAVRVIASEMRARQL
ncbi:regulatory protein RecX [Brachybacterium hainanense]|uniref:Regulatory protein RecX n=1 Tax=Brachybacterium hainanense TaxID=1541174 RepID=A0ABV6RHT0_9MICO